MNAVLKRILASGVVKDEQGKDCPLSANIAPREGELLQRFILELRPKVSVEIGLGFGVSTLYICDALAEVGGHKHIVCDPDQFEGFRGIGWKNICEAGYEHLVELHPVSSHVLLPQLEQQGLRIGFAFIDGWHTFDYVMIDFFYVDRLLLPGGIVVFDDVAYPAVRKLCRYITTNRTYEVAGGDNRPASGQRRIAEWAARFAGLSRFCHPSLICADSRLGINASYVALRKTSDDVLGSGQNRTRRWDQHTDF